MSDTTIKAAQLETLNTALLGVFPLTPPPTPKGRYFLSTAAGIIGPSTTTYQQNKQALIEKWAKRDDEGKLISVVNTDALGRKVATFPLTDAVAFAAELKEIDDIDIVLTGVRVITHAELGACPITVAQETALRGILLEAVEPA